MDAWEAGAIQRLLSKERAQATATKRDSMRTKRHTPIPLARMAVISLSAASLPRPIRMPTSTPMGMV